MKITITFKAKDSDSLTLPTAYNEILQGFIYHNLDGALATFLHDQGFSYEKRHFRMFAFSRIFGRYHREPARKAIRFEGPAHFYITTAYEMLSQDLANQMLLGEGFNLNGISIDVQSVNIEKTVVPEGRCIVKTLSPITVYSTIVRPDGRKFQYFFKPGDSDYDEMITANLIKKYTSFYGKPIEGQVHARPIGPMKARKVYYKNIGAEAYDGRIEMSGSGELIKMGLEAGLGSKNAQGYGCVMIDENWKGDDRLAGKHG